MPSIVRVQARFAAKSGLPADSVINTWHFAMTDSSNGAHREDIFDKLVTFYGASMFGHWSPSVAQDGHTLTMYDLADPEPRVAIDERVDIDLGAGHDGAFAIPSEVALVLSFRGTFESGVPKARRRGRIYFGPFDSSVLSTDATTGRCFPDAALREDFTDAAEVLRAASAATVNWSWVTYSRVDDFGSEVVSGFVDDAFDTQRRRGEDATARSVFP